MPLTELPPLRRRDVVLSTATTQATMCACVHRIVECVKSSSTVVFNTFDDLERSDLLRITADLHVPAFAVGPLHKLSSGAESILLPQDRDCLQWLDAQETESVLYVSFGSLASMDPPELSETAWGLGNSGQPFLWVVRDGSLPDGFEEATRGRGRVVRWAPQQDVLRHRAVGGFWTHCGWNSTLESVCEGIPMMCRPQLADQMVNARYVQEVWRVGFELEGELERGSVERAVRRLLCEEEGRQMRRRVRETTEKAARCLGKAGSSTIAIDLLVDRIMSL